MFTLAKYFKISAIIPFSITITFGVILSLTHDGSDYKSEWFTDDGFVLTVMLTILLSGLISLLSLTLFLNRRPFIKKRSLLSFLTWVLLPGIVCLFIIYQETLKFTGHSDIDGTYEGSRLLDGYIISVGILHLLALFATYSHFKITSKSNE